MADGYLDRAVVITLIVLDVSDFSIGSPYALIGASRHSSGKMEMEYLNPITTPRMVVSFTCEKDISENESKMVVRTILKRMDKIKKFLLSEHFDSIFVML